MPTTTEVEDLMRQIAHLEAQIVDLQSHVIDAKEHARGATKRAQSRYTEKIHANRRSERLEQDLAKEKWERKDDQIKSIRLVGSYQDTITQLRGELARQQGASADGTQLQVYQDQLAHLNVSNEEYHKENIQLKNELDQEKLLSSGAIERLNNTISKLSADLATEKTTKAPAAEVPEDEKLEARMEEITEQKVVERLERQKLELAKRIQQRVGAMYSQKLEEMKQNIQQKQTNFITGVEQLKKVYEDEKQKTSILQQQLIGANDQILWWKQQVQRQTAGQSSQDIPEKRVGKRGSVAMTPQQSDSHLRDVANKRRRLKTGG